MESLYTEELSINIIIITLTIQTNNQPHFLSIFHPKCQISPPLAAPHLNGTIHTNVQVLEYHHILMALRGVLFVFAPSDRQVPTHASPLDADKYLGYVSNLLIGKTSGLSDSRIPGCLARWHCVCGEFIMRGHSCFNDFLPVHWHCSCCCHWPYSLAGSLSGSLVGAQKQDLECPKFLVSIRSGSFPNNSTYLHTL